MSAYLLGVASIYPGLLNAREQQGNRLAASTQELAGLRFSIILTARWVASASEEIERRNELRTELEELRRRYSEKIDEIAMTFGVQNAIDAKENVERTVTVPSGLDLYFTTSTTSEDDYPCL